MTIHLSRREVIAVVGGAALTRPLVARAQQERVRRVGVLMGTEEANPDGRQQAAALRRGLQELGWVDGHTVHIEYRWVAGEPTRAKLYARDLINLDPDVLVTHGTPTSIAVQAETRTIPIVFVNVADPVGLGLVTKFPRPGAMRRAS
jgi:putative tryptophan/tyrosine transport system substrate-binding protein